MRKIRMLRDNLIIEPFALAERTASGLYLALSAQERPQLAYVMASSPNNEVKVGDMVLFPRFWDNHITIEGRSMLRIRTRDLYAVIEV